MMVHIHRAEARPCDGCGRSSVMCDVRVRTLGTGLEPVPEVFPRRSRLIARTPGFTSTLVEAAGRIKGDLEAMPDPHGT